jgi:hypothetical protein
MTAKDYENLHIYMDNGDKEHTLCRSNEELHILMHKQNIPHQYRVREGGHSFEYWCSALPNALRFISDGFESKPYRGDIFLNPQMQLSTADQDLTITIGNIEIPVIVPQGYPSSDRLYPVIYFTGKFSGSQVKSIACIVNHETANINVCPMLLVFLPDADTAFLKAALPVLEEKLRIRSGYRFRAVAGFEGSAENVFLLATGTEQFSACILTDAFITQGEVSDRLAQMNPEALSRTSFFIEAPDQGQYCQGNGTLHMLLRDRDMSHEYRVREGTGGFEWALNGLPEIIRFTAKRFHK